MGHKFLRERSFGVLIESLRLAVPVTSLPGARRLMFSLVLFIVSCIELAVWTKTAGYSINVIRCTFAILTTILNLALKIWKTQRTSIVIYRYQKLLIQLLREFCGCSFVFL